MDDDGNHRDRELTPEETFNRVRDWVRASCPLVVTCFRAAHRLAPPARDPCFEDEDRWYKDFQPDPKATYEEALKYAEAKYAESLQNFDQLDSKAEAMFRLAGILAALLFSVVQHFQVPRVWYLVASFICFLLAMIYSALCRRPVTVHGPWTIRAMLEQAPHHTEPELRANLAASMHCAWKGTTAANEWKADKLVLVTALLCLAVALLTPALFL